mmetsp:Transcript_3314/g.5057  ORF Transcript_3314/g.5057 Transcript_3314/m.5057 type:complete len:202 (+) Transcript_3314:46-651(+)
MFTSPVLHGSTTTLKDATLLVLEVPWITSVLLPAMKPVLSIVVAVLTVPFPTLTPGTSVPVLQTSHRKNQFRILPPTLLQLLLQPPILFQKRVLRLHPRQHQKIHQQLNQLPIQLQKKQVLHLLPSQLRNPHLKNHRQLNQLPILFLFPPLNRKNNQLPILSQKKQVLYPPLLLLPTLHQKINQLRNLNRILLLLRMICIG